MKKLKQFLKSLAKPGKKGLAAALVVVMASSFIIGRDSEKADIYDNSDLKNRSVKIVNFAKRSGGSGSIISSNKRESTILTNNHVCQIIVNGGLVVTNKGDFAVTSYKRSQRHDLCLITVGTDLGVNTKIAPKAPELQEEAAISGHPRLLPNVITRGHFSGKEVIKILTGIRECTQEDLEGENALLCAFLRGIPTVTTYEAQLVTAFIQGGSSGSPVYNASGEIAAVAFAGSGEISQAYVVPYEAVATFFEEELPKLAKNIPNMSQEISARDLARRENGISRETITKLCNDPKAKGPAYEDVCSVSAVQGDLTWAN